MLSWVEIHIHAITKPYWTISTNSSRSRSFSRCARERPLAPDFWNAELSIQNSTTQPRHLGASARTASTTVSPSRKSIILRAAAVP